MRIGGPPQIPAELGWDWVHVLTAMTASDPASRPSASEVGSLLQRIAAGQTMPGSASFALLFADAWEAERSFEEPGVGAPVPLATTEAPLTLAAPSRRRSLGWALLVALTIPALMAVSMFVVKAVSPSHRHAPVPAHPVVIQPAAPSSTRNYSPAPAPAPIAVTSAPATSAPVPVAPPGASSIAHRPTSPPARATGSRASTGSKPGSTSAAAEHSSQPAARSSTAPPTQAASGPSESEASSPSTSGTGSANQSTATSSAPTPSAPTARPPSRPATATASASAALTSP